MAEYVVDLPDGFLDELELDKSRKDVLLEQINRFNALNEMSISNKEINYDANGNIVFPAGTIIHGTSNCNPDMVTNIAKTGILTGQAVGISEDGETYYCADFHRVPHDMSVEDFNLWFPYRDGRCPFNTLGKISLAFVIQPSEELNELLSYDCYRIGTPNGDLTGSFIYDLPMAGNVASSILYGVPSSAISGIVMGDNLFKKKEIVGFVSGLFPSCYIISKKGNLIYDPKCNGIDNEELTELRRQNYLSLLRIEELEQKLGSAEASTVREKSNYDKLLNALIDTCGCDVAADVLLATGWQGSKESTVGYVERLQEINSSKRNK